MNHRFFLFTLISFTFMLRADLSSYRAKIIDGLEKEIQDAKVDLSMINTQEEKIKAIIAQFPNNYHELPLNNKISISMKFFEQIQDPIYTIAMKAQDLLYEESELWNFDIRGYTLDSLKTILFESVNILLRAKSDAEEKLKLMKTPSNETISLIVNEAPTFYAQRKINQSILTIKKAKESKIVQLTQTKEQWEGTFYLFTSYLPRVIKEKIDLPLLGLRIIPTLIYVYILEGIRRIRS